MLLQMWNGFAHWLRSAPIADPVDRRNAPVMQVLLLFYGALLPLTWVWHAVTRGIQAGEPVVLLMDMVIAALAWVSIAMIRHGRFRPAIVLFLAPQLISMGITFFALGVQSQLLDPAPTMLTLVISGLVLGRNALWIAFGLLMLVFATGFVSDAIRATQLGVPLRRALANAPVILISYSLITIVLDRSIKALRESLAESDARGRDLQREMAERERAQAQLIHSQKMEATGRLASGLSHDFNNILDVISGYAEQRHDIPDIENRDARDAAFSKALGSVEVAAARGTALTRKLLTFSRHDMARPQVFDAVRLIAELQPMLRQLLPRNIRLDMPDPTEPLPVRIDRSEFEMMILNIAANARDAMEQGGRFGIRLEGKPDGIVEIALSDTGHGMDDDVLQHIFEPFFTTKDAVDGTGLGLAVIRDLLKTAGGNISVRSTVGEGTTFLVQLPLEPAPLPG
ncbi:sensor histidine kinase [Luteimonas cucumeris]|nr:ATP-binding protein [Luteimonas cucumeris]